jgi:hypothetical protein
MVKASAITLMSNVVLTTCGTILIQRFCIIAEPFRLQMPLIKKCVAANYKEDVQSFEQQKTHCFLKISLVHQCLAIVVLGSGRQSCQVAASLGTVIRGIITRSR